MSLRLAPPIPQAGIVYREHAEPPGCLVYYAVDGTGQLAYRVELPVVHATPEWITFLERQAARLADQEQRELRLLP